jgi:hypothetical protein
MKRETLFTIWGVLLIVAGLLFFIQGRDYISVNGADDSGWAVVWAATFAVAAISFLWAYFSDRSAWWWAVIPGTTLLGLATIIALGAFWPQLGGNWIGSIFMAAIGLGFWLVYFAQSNRWWAIIPGGTMLSLTALVLLSGWFSGEALASVLFFGLAITFGLLYVVPGPGQRAVWPLLPAGVMALLGLALLLAFGAVLNYVWAVALILVGVYLLYRQNGPGRMTRRG